MTRQLYIRARSPNAAAALVSEVRGQGVPQDHVRIYGRGVPRDFPAKVVRWRSRARAYAEGGAFGLGAMLVIALLLGGFGLETLFLPAVGAVLGAAIWRRRTRAATAPVASQSMALDDGELILGLALDDERLGAVEQSLEKRHPELMILGSDAAGTPPFP